MDKDNIMEEEKGQVDDVMWLQDLLVAVDRCDLQRLSYIFAGMF